MSHVLRAVCAGALGAAFVSSMLVACSSSSSGDAASAGGGPGSGGTTGAGGSAVDGGPGAGGTGTGTGGAGAAGAGTGGSGATSGTLKSGRVEVSQQVTGGMFLYGVSATFVKQMLSTTMPMACPEAMTVTMGACTAFVTCVPPKGDGGLPPSVSLLNAGTITVAGGSGPAGAAVLTYGVLPQAMPPQSGYESAKGNTAFYAPGDVLTATGQGGPDLPAFTAPSVVAPHDVLITAPAGCAKGSCPDLDRTQDFIATWTGGSAGKVFFAFETLSDKLVTAVTCNFDASAGTGTIPSALLGHLEKSTSGGMVTAIYVIATTNESPSFLVGDVPTTFQVQGSAIDGLLTISK